MFEKFAELAHRVWGDWMIYMFEQGDFKKDGTWVMPKEKADRWLKQSHTHYKDLTEKEKRSDRGIAQKYLEIKESP